MRWRPGSRCVSQWRRHSLWCQEVHSYITCYEWIEQSSETRDLLVLLYSHYWTLTKERYCVNVPIVHLMECMILIQPQGTYPDWVRLFWCMCGTGPGLDPMDLIPRQGFVWTNILILFVLTRRQGCTSLCIDYVKWVGNAVAMTVGLHKNWTVCAHREMTPACAPTTAWHLGLSHLF